MHSHNSAQNNFGWTSLGMLDEVAGHAQDRSRFACVAGLRTEVCLRSRAYDRGPLAWQGLQQRSACVEGLTTE